MKDRSILPEDVLHTALIALACLAGRAEAAPERLFSDISLRYPVGDTNAENPIGDTEGPKTLATADLNADGLGDVIVGNLDGSVSVLLGQANNSLAPQILVPATGIPTNSSLQAVAVADFNHDTHLDVAVADISGKGVVVLLGSGDGRLAPHRRTDVGPARAIAAADFNRDGNPDLLVACSPPDCEWCRGVTSNNATNRFLCILDGDGDGSFAPPRYLLTPGVEACFYDVDAADIDGDGDADALALDFNSCSSAGSIQRTRRLSIFANDGTGSFAINAPDRILEPSGGGPRAFRVAYLDELRPGGTNPLGATLDIVIVNRDSSTLDVFLNTGGLNFTNVSRFHAGDTPRDVAVGDLDGDGRSDLVVVHRNTDALSVLRGLGGGQFSSTQIEYLTGVSPRQIVVSDMNGDGVLDAAVNNRISEDISLFIGRKGLAGFLVPDVYYPSGISPVSLVAEDFDHDGFPDVATANLRSHDVRVRLNRRDGSLGPETAYAVNFEPAVIATGDLNGDGHLDLVVTCLGSGTGLTPTASGSLVTLLGLGDGNFRPPVAMALSSHFGQPYWLRLADLDGDGKVDAAISSILGNLAVFRGADDGTFESAKTVGFPGMGRPLGLAIGDFDSDGRLDMATSQGKIYLNDGHFFDGSDLVDGAWTGPTKSFKAGIQAWATETEDLDGDHNLDLMVALTFGRPDPIGVLFGSGDARFTEPDTYQGPDEGAVAIVGQDMDGDQIKDLVVGNRCAASVIVMRGLGNRRFAYWEIVKAFAVDDVAVADMNQDGKPDIVGVGGGLWVMLQGVQPRLVEPTEFGFHATPNRDGLFINELMALNKEFHVINNATPDWVEIYNHSSVAQNLAGWSLAQYTADGETNRWSFPLENSVQAPPWGRLVVYCQKNPGTNVGLYATFELSSDGENLALLDPSGAEIDFVRFPALPADVSYARYSDGARYFAFNPAPTLGAANQRPANIDPSAERKDPYVGPGGSALGLTARLFDDVAIAYAAVCYRPADSNAFTETLLYDDGQHGDKQAGDGYFGAILPPIPEDTVMEYYLRAVDIEGKVDTSPDDLSDPAKLYRVRAPKTGSSIRLSELVAANQSGLRDERGQAEDWVELVNNGADGMDLFGLVLTKDYFDQDAAWHFPSNSWLGPGGRAIVFCDEDPKQGPMHATFKLLRGGDRIFLIRADDWSILDSLSFGPLPSDTSFGVLGDGTEAQLLAWATPGAENIPIPSSHDPRGGPPEMFWRADRDVDTGQTTLAMRWLSDPGTLFEVRWSSDLRRWQRARAPVTNLGEGIFQWTDFAVESTRFYRVFRVP